MKRTGSPSSGTQLALSERIRRHFRERVDPLTSLFLVLPLYVVYQIGTTIRMECRHGVCRGMRNGADLLTDTVLSLAGGSRLAVIALALLVGVVLAIAILATRGKEKLHPRLFVPVLLESAFYASLVGPISHQVLQGLGLGALEGSLWIDDVVSSFGAGLHEELVFRAGLFAGGIALFERMRWSRTKSVLTSLVLSSVLFSLAHHIGPVGEPFTLSAFAFRFVAGGLFAAVYSFRGFAIAAWTHALYDVWVFSLQRFVG